MQIELTKNELCFVDDSLTLHRELDDSDLSKYVHRVVAPSAGAAASAELLSKLGGALIESHELYWMKYPILQSKNKVTTKMKSNSTTILKRNNLSLI